ncbi:response regulator [Okeania sp. SIO1I7]|uniref:response regulator n=1 Tax=Okeania sp. SIO1I7 TaxID=2607772 RepID=UPI0013F93162|nr:response regulator [Okeania sp. SIO1I7]NET28189.1 response regulator [Okeania sp. SIO1I7]
MNILGKNCHIPAENLQWSERITITQGDIISQQVEAIVNPTNNNLRSYGLCTKIHQAAGEALTSATRQIEWLDISEAKITKGYQLQASYIIHTCAPVWDKTNSQTSSQQLAQCYHNCLEVAAKNQINTLAFPCISTGMRGFPRDWAAKIAMTEVVKFLQHNSLPWKIIFVCRESDDYEQYQVHLPTDITSPTFSEQTQAQIAKSLVAQIECQRRVAIIGSTSFWGVTTEAICKATGRQLATLENLALLTGGVMGVPEAVSLSFWRECQQQNKFAPVYHIQPAGFELWEYGVNLYGGKTLSERREILAQMASIYILIEGGPGAKQEAETAMAAGAVVIPVGVTGGFAKELYQKMSRPYYIPFQLWQKLGEGYISSETVAEAIAQIMEKIWQRPKDVMFNPDKKSVTDLELRSALGVNYRKLRDLLAASQWQKADWETFRLFCEIALRVEVHKGVREIREILKTINKNTQPDRFYELTDLLQYYQTMFHSIHQQEFPSSSFYGYLPGCLNWKFINKLPLLDLQTIDLLWMVYSCGHFGFSVQERIWQTLFTQDEAKVEENFISCVGRGYSQGEDAYQEGENFTLSSPEGLLPWLNWYDAGGNLHGIECDGKLRYLTGGFAQKGVMRKLWQEGIRKRLEVGDNDFSNCVLSGLNLQGLNFQGANLRGADLRNANCEGAVFADADLRGANLVGAKFSVGALQEAVIDRSDGCSRQWLKSYTILIVDDSIIVRQLLSTTFTNAGYEVEIARNGVEAWEKLQNNLHIDLILLDLEMPRMDGYELTKKIRNDSKLKNILIAILTNRSIPRNKQKEIQEEFNYCCYLNKPFAEEKVLETVNNIFNRSVKPETILIVDDSITIRELLSMTFIKAGYQLEVAKDGLEAWNKLQNNLHIDLILLNIEMPKMDGQELALKIRRDSKLQNLPIVFMTSRGASRMGVPIEKLVKNCAYLTKPYVEENVLDTVKSLLKK